MQVRLDVNKRALQRMDAAMEHGERPVLKLSADEVQNTISDQGTVPMNLNKSQVDRLRGAGMKMRPFRMTMTQAQTDRVLKNGGFLGILGSIGRVAAPMIAKALPVLGKAALGAAAGTAASAATKKVVGRGLYLSPSGGRVSLGSGLFLRPMRQGGGLVDDAMEEVMGVLEDAKGAVVPISREILGNLIKNVGKTGKRALGTVGEKLVKLGSGPSSHELMYDGNRINLPKRGGFLSGILSSIGL